MIKILFLWDGVRKRDLAEKDMAEIISENYNLTYATPEDIFLKIKQPHDILWLGIYHRVLPIDFTKLFDLVTSPVIIDQADNEHFMKHQGGNKALPYNKIKRGVFCSRYLPYAPLKVYANSIGLTVKQLSWYINPKRFRSEEKTIDVCFLGSMNARRNDWLDKLKNINEISIITGSYWGDEYADILAKSKVSIVECERKCLTQKYIESSLSGCTLVGDVVERPKNSLSVYYVKKLGLEKAIRMALEQPVVNNIESSFLSEFNSIVNELLLVQRKLDGHQGECW